MINRINYFLDAELPVTANLAVVKSADQQSETDIEKLLLAITATWGIDAKKVVSVSLSLALGTFFKVSKKMFIHAAIFSCLMEAVSEIITEFEEKLAKLSIIETKVTEVYRFLL
jgi:hypothetical protein